MTRYHSVARLLHFFLIVFYSLGLIYFGVDSRDAKDDGGYGVGE